MKYGPTKYKLDEELHQLFEKFYLPSLVLDLGGLGYFTKYPSPPSSSTKLGIINFSKSILKLVGPYFTKRQVSVKFFVLN